MNNQQGFIVVTSLVIATSVLLLMGVFYGSVVSERKAVERSFRNQQALNLAEAGVELAIWELNQGDITTWSGDVNYRTKTLQSSDLAGVGACTVAISGPTTSNPIVSASGHVPSLSVAVEKQVHQNLHVSLVRQAGTGSSFEYAIAVRGHLILENETSSVVGDVYTIGDIDNLGVPVTGKGYSTGTVSGDGFFSDGTEEGVDAISFPTVDFAAYEAKAASNGTVINGDFTVADDPNYMVPEVLYVKGNFKAENSHLYGPGVIVAEGRILMEDHSTCGASGAAVGLLSASDSFTEAIKLEVDSDVYGYLQAPYGGVMIETDGSVYGSVIGGGEVEVRVKAETGGGVVWTDHSGDIDLPPPPGDDEYVVSSWRRVG